MLICFARKQLELFNVAKILADTDCQDKTASDGTTDCPQRASLCHESDYYDYMTEKCPKTCGRCQTTATR